MSESNDPVAATAPAEVTPNLTLAVLAGLAAAIAGAVIWAVITVSTKYQIGFMAIGVGFLVGWTVRSAGKGGAMSFSLIGGALALFGCLLGNLLSACGFLAAEQGMPLMTIVVRALSNPSLAVELLRATFNPMDLLFYAIAVYEGFTLARRPIVRPAAAAAT
ncbi:MAG TPA: hypothetical protein VKC11_04395 [Steroidobacteraceae bacterium]|nr:hypothetical protein [Steroidobacteraceae bacterium]